MGKTFKSIYIAILIAMGLVLHIIESYIPIPIGLPGAKLGLANIVSLLALVFYGPLIALLVAFFRTILGSILIGAISSIPYSLNGAISSTIVMWYFFKYLSPKLSLIGVSVIGSAIHNIAQVFTAIIILNNINIALYIPILLIIGTITGYFIGLVSNLTVKNLKINITKL